MPFSFSFLCLPQFLSDLFMFSPPACIADVDVRSQENNLAHRTREIDRERLIVRRGQPFSITLQYCDPLPSKHRLELVLHLGRHRPPRGMTFVQENATLQICFVALLSHSSEPYNYSDQSLQLKMNLCPSVQARETR